MRYVRLSTLHLPSPRLTLNGVNKTAGHSLHAFHELVGQGALPGLKTREVLNASLLQIHFFYLKLMWQNL